MKTQTISHGIQRYVTVDIGKAPTDLQFLVRKASHLVLLIHGKASKNVQSKITIRLVESDAKAEIIGCIRTLGKGILDLESRQMHEAPNTTSDLHIKSVLSDESRFTYHGVIAVDKQAQKTDAYQKNDNLLLSPDVFCDSEPTLEIQANDVRCTHGSTTSPISDEGLWYITSRGVDVDAAKTLITNGFLFDITQKISNQEQKNNFEKKIWALL